MASPHYPGRQGNSGSPLAWVAIGIIGLGLVLVSIALFQRPGPTTVEVLPTGQASQGQQAQPSESSERSVLADSYTGSSVNRTVEEELPNLDGSKMDGSAVLRVTFGSKDPTDLQGEITVTGAYVGGSGPFTGTLDGDKIQLEVDPVQVDVPNYYLTGMVYPDGRIAGELRVPAIPSLGLPVQTGDWRLQPDDS